MTNKDESNKTKKYAYKKGGGFSDEERAKGLETKRKKTAEKKKVFLEVFTNTLGNISHSCRSAKIVRRTYEKWMNNDEDFARSVYDVNQSNIDLAESMLMRNIKEGKEASIFFKLKTQARDRGYIERQEVIHNQKSKYETMTLEELENELSKYD